MKITKKHLRQLLKEEITKLILSESTEDEKMGTGGIAQHATDQRVAMRQGGIDDKERAAIATVSQRLAAAAKAGNILSGTLARRLEQLVAEIDKALGNQQTTQQGQGEQG